MNSVGRLLGNVTILNQNQMSFSAHLYSLKPKMFYTYTDISVIGCSWQIISVNDIGWVLVMSTEKN